MSPRNFSFLAIVTVILLILVCFAPSYGWKLRSWLGPQGAPDVDAVSITAQNEALSAQLAELTTVEAEIPTTVTSTIRAMAYSRYPFNFKNKILISVGSNEGIVSGKAVLYQGVLIGIVGQVFPDEAAVTTVFDPSFKMPVRIGSNGVDALLQGGDFPEAVSITKGAKVAVRDIVVAAGPGVPYGLPIGTVGDITPSSDHLFDQATLNFAYDINGIQTVLVEK